MFQKASVHQAEEQVLDCFWVSCGQSDLGGTFHSQSGPHLVLEADVFSSLNLHSAVVASIILQDGVTDAQRQVVLPRVSLQPIALVLLRARLTGGGSGPAGAAVQDGGSLPVAQTPHDLQGGMLGVLRMAEGARQHHRVALDASYLRLNLHKPAVFCRAEG